MITENSDLTNEQQSSGSNGTDVTSTNNSNYYELVSRIKINEFMELVTEKQNNHERQFLAVGVNKISPYLENTDKLLTEEAITLLDIMFRIAVTVNKIENQINSENE